MTFHRYYQKLFQLTRDMNHCSYTCPSLVTFLTFFWAARVAYSAWPVDYSLEPFVYFLPQELRIPVAQTAISLLQHDSRSPFPDLSLPCSREALRLASLLRRRGGRIPSLKDSDIVRHHKAILTFADSRLELANGVTHFYYWLDGTRLSLSLSYRL